MANLTTKIYTYFYGKLVGEDEFGNKYYASSKKEGKHIGRPNKERRWVIYNGSDEPSKVPPLWHSWMHYTVDTAPSIRDFYSWEQPHTPNLTGTKHAHKSQFRNVKNTAWHPK